MIFILVKRGNTNSSGPYLHWSEAENWVSRYGAVSVPRPLLGERAEKSSSPQRLDVR